MSSAVQRRAMLLAAGVAAIAGNAAADTVSDFQKIMDKYAAALKTGDVETLVGLYSPKGVFMREEMKAVVGQDALRAAYKEVFATLKVDLQFTVREAEEAGDMAWLRSVSKGTVKILKTGVGGQAGLQPARRVPQGRRRLEDPRLSLRLQPARRPARRRPERHVRRALHRPAGRSPLRGASQVGEAAGRRKLRLPVGPRRRRRRPRACGATRHRPAGSGVRPRRQAFGQLGRRSRWPSRTTSPPATTAPCWWPTATPIRCCASIGTASSCRRWASGTGPRSMRRSTIRRRRPRRADGEIYVADGYGNSSVHRFAADGSLITHLGRPGQRSRRLHHAACHRRRPPRPRAGGRSREQPRAGLRPRGQVSRRMGRLLSPHADLDRRPRPGVRHRPDPAHQPADARRQAGRPLPRRHQRRARPGRRRRRQPLSLRVAAAGDHQARAARPRPACRRRSGCGASGGGTGRCRPAQCAWRCGCPRRRSSPSASGSGR